VESKDQPGELTALDWIGAVVASLGGLFCFQFPFLVGRSFKQMFAELGGPLPTITQLGLTVWFPIVLGMIPMSVLALALFRKAPLGARRALIVGAFILSLVSSGLCLYAVYAPIFEIAGAIKAE
jgi:hypothetical protein